VPIYTYVLNRLKYLTKKSNKDNQQVTESITEEIDDEEILKTENMMLKSMVVNNDNMKEIMTKIRRTAKFRANMLKNIEVDLRTEFPYFFSHGELVRIR
jgi:argininosuccinate lyase